MSSSCPAPSQIPSWDPTAWELNCPQSHLRCLLSSILPNPSRPFLVSSGDTEQPGSCCGTIPEEYLSSHSPSHRSSDQTSAHLPRQVTTDPQLKIYQNHLAGPSHLVTSHIKSRISQLKFLCLATECPSRHSSFPVALVFL